MESCHQACPVPKLNPRTLSLRNNGSRHPFLAFGSEASPPDPCGSVKVARYHRGVGPLSFRSRVADWIDADTDDEAVAKARQIERGVVRCEVWRDKRLVAKLDTHDLTN